MGTRLIHAVAALYRASGTGVLRRVRSGSGSSEERESGGGNDGEFGVHFEG